MTLEQLYYYFLNLPKETTNEIFRECYTTVTGKHLFNHTKIKIEYDCDHNDELEAEIALIYEREYDSAADTYHLSIYKYRGVCYLAISDGDIDGDINIDGDIDSSSLVQIVRKHKIALI
jgi:hypothetical protein